MTSCQRFLDGIFLRMHARGIRDGIHVEDVTVAVAGVAVEVGVVGVEMSKFSPKSADPVRRVGAKPSLSK